MLPGFVEILIIAGLAIILFGYERIPGLGKSLGRGVCEFKKSFKKAADLIDSADEPDDKDEKR